jgi:hypothetical protein
MRRHESNDQIGTMYSKRIQTAIRIIGFLFCTIGLLYISMKIRDRTEGFQVASANVSCTNTNMNGKNTWLCPTDFDAQILDRVLLSNANVTDAVCYDSQMGYYTCLTRPPDQTFVPSDGLFINADPIDDTLPNSIINDIRGVCNDYNTNTAYFSTIYVSTTMLNGVISSAIGEINYGTTQLSNISTLYCATPASGSPALTTAVLNACTSLGAGIGAFSNIPRSANGLYFMSTTVADSLKEMENTYTNTFAPAYRGFKTCSNIS